MIVDLRIDTEEDAQWLINCAMVAINESYEKGSVRHNEMTELHAKLNKQLENQVLVKNSGFLRIDSNDVYWIVNPKLTDKVERGEQVVKLEWGFDWDENQILMTKSMAEMLRDKLNEIL